jgi:hypothetical protein
MSCAFQKNQATPEEVLGQAFPHVLLALIWPAHPQVPERYQLERGVARGVERHDCFDVLVSRPGCT